MARNIAKTTSSARKITQHITFATAYVRKQNVMFRLLPERRLCTGAVVKAVPYIDFFTIMVISIRKYGNV
jgi:hypothetical protein